MLEFSVNQSLKVLEGVIPVTYSSRSAVLTANSDLMIEALNEAGECFCHITCQLTGTPRVLTFNLQFLSDTIKTFDGDGLATLRSHVAIHTPTRGAPEFMQLNKISRYPIST